MMLHHCTLANTPQQIERDGKTKVKQRQEPLCCMITRSEMNMLKQLYY